MNEFNSWINELVYLNTEQRLMLSNCMSLMLQHEVTDEWLIGSLEPLSYEDKNKFIEFSNLIYMQNKMGV